MKKLSVLIFAVTFILLSACTQTVDMPTVTPTQTIAVPQGTPTADEINSAINLLVDMQKAEATNASIQLTMQYLGAYQTATKQASEYAATQNSMAMTQKAFAIESTATYQAFIVVQANTQQAWVATGTAQIVGTQTAFPQTAAASTTTQLAAENNATATAQMAQVYDNAKRVSVEANSESVELALQRERITNLTKAIVPWLAFIVALGLIVLLAIRASRVRIVPKDSFGSWSGLLIDGKAVDMDTTTSAEVVNGEIKFKTANEKMQENNARIRLVRALPAGQGDSITENMFPTPREEPRFTVIGQSDAPPPELLTDEALKALEVDWNNK